MISLSIAIGCAIGAMLTAFIAEELNKQRVTKTGCFILLCLWPAILPIEVKKWRSS